MQEEARRVSVAQADADTARITAFPSPDRRASMAYVDSPRLDRVLLVVGRDTTAVYA